MSRILHVITTLETGGAEKLLVELLPRLQKHCDVELAVFVGTRTPFFDLLKSAGIKIHVFNDKGSVYRFSNILSLIRLARRFDIIHTHNTAPQFFGAIASLFCKAKFCTTEHTTTNRHRVWWFKPIERWMYGKYEQIICISPGVKKVLIDTFGEILAAKITVIPNGIDTGVFRKASSVCKDMPQNHVSGRRVITMVGRCSYQKDQATVIRALSKLSNKYELWLVGDGDTLNGLKELVHKLCLEDQVVFWGSRKDVPDLMKASDIIVQSSHIEGFGLAAVEGMASGKPVIATDIPGLRGVVEGAGVLFKHQDDDGLASIIERVMNDSCEYQMLVERGRKRADQYDINTMAANYLNIYRNLITSM